MTRFIAGAFATALLVAGISMTVTPASGHPDTCTGQSTANTNPVYYPTLGPSATGPVTLAFITGGCVVSGVRIVNGEFTGGLTGSSCGHSTGRVGVDGHLGTWVSAGSVWVFTGPSLVGVLNNVPDAAAGHNCVTGAFSYIMTGSFETI